MTHENTELQGAAFDLRWRQSPVDSSCVPHIRSLVPVVVITLTTEAGSSSVVARVGAGQGDGSDGR